MGRSPLLTACGTNGTTLEVFELLYYKWPEAIRLVVSEGEDLPIHELCYNEKLNDKVSIDILAL